GAAAFKRPRPRFLYISACDPSAVDRHWMAGDERGCVREQPNHPLRYLLGLTHAPHRLTGIKLLLGEAASVDNPLHHRGANYSGTHAIDANIPGCVFECRSSRQADHAVL